MNPSNNTSAADGCRHPHRHPLPEPGPASEAERALLERLISAMDRPGLVIGDVAAGGMFIGVLSGGRMGLSSTLGAEPGPGDAELMRAMTGMTAGDAARLLFRPSAFAICLGLAALNLGLDPPEEGKARSAEDVIAEKGADADVVLVGHFPFTERLRSRVGRLHLLELQDVPGSVPRSQWDNALSRCRVAGVTGTIFLTRYADWFLSRTPEAFTILMGPSTPLSPVLFQAGADALAGSVVTDPGPVLDGIRNNLPFHQMKKRGGLRFVYLEKPGSPR